PTVVELGRGAPAVIVEPLVRVANRVIVDTAHTTSTRVAELAGKTRASIADRAFVRTFSWRELVARFFDDAPRAARTISRVSIERTPDGKHDPAGLMLGWLASRLGWRFESATRAAGPAGGVTIEVKNPESHDDIGALDIACVRLEASLDGQP